MNINCSEMTALITQPELDPQAGFQNGLMFLILISVGSSSFFWFDLVVRFDGPIRFMLLHNRKKRMNWPLTFKVSETYFQTLSEISITYFTYNINYIIGEIKSESNSPKF